MKLNLIVDLQCRRYVIASGTSRHYQICKPVKWSCNTRWGIPSVPGQTHVTRGNTWPVNRKHLNKLQPKCPWINSNKCSKYVHNFCFFPGTLFVLSDVWPIPKSLNSHLFSLHSLPCSTVNGNDMLSYSLTTMMCFLTKEWYGFSAYTVNLFLKAYYRITYKEDLKIT